jgi:hypothetical protein
MTFTMLLSTFGGMNLSGLDGDHQEGRARMQVQTAISNDLRGHKRIATPSPTSNLELSVRVRSQDRSLSVGERPIQAFD